MTNMEGEHLSKMYRASQNDAPAMSRTIAVLEEFGRSLSDTQLTDDTVDSVVALGLGTMTVLQKLFPPGTVPSIRKDYLQVADGESLEGFLERAKEAYREAHGHTPKRGRKTEDIDAFMTLLELSAKSKDILKQNEMVKALMKINSLSKNTSYKYAKLFLLSLRWTPDQTKFTDAERLWFAKNNGFVSRSRLWWMSRYLNRLHRLEEIGGAELF